MKCGCKQIDCPYNQVMPLTSVEIARARARGKARREKAAKAVVVNIVQDPPALRPILQPWFSRRIAR